MRIAFFDSGIGGITVLNEAVKQMPTEDFLYFADTLHVPYGTKSKDVVRQYVQEVVEVIVKEEVKALVIACNTATSIAVSDLRDIYDIPIIGMEPAVKPAVEMNRTTGKRVLVFATPLTLKQNKYMELVSRIDDQHLVDSLPLPELVEYCENLVFDEDVISAYFREQLKDFDLQLYGTVVLGCTHYPFYKNMLRKFLPEHIKLIDGGGGTVNRLIQVLQEHDQFNLHGTANIKFMCSSQDEAYIRKMKKAFEVIEQLS